MQASPLGATQSISHVVSRIVKDLMGAEVPADQVHHPLLLHLGIGRMAIVVAIIYLNNML